MQFGSLELPSFTCCFVSFKSFFPPLEYIPHNNKNLPPQSNSKFLLLVQLITKYSPPPDWVVLSRISSWRHRKISFLRKTGFTQITSYIVTLHQRALTTKIFRIIIFSRVRSFPFYVRHISFYAHTIPLVKEKIGRLKIQFWLGYFLQKKKNVIFLVNYQTMKFIFKKKNLLLITHLTTAIIEANPLSLRIFGIAYVMASFHYSCVALKN